MLCSPSAGCHCHSQRGDAPGKTGILVLMALRGHQARQQKPLLFPWGRKRDSTCLISVLALKPGKKEVEHIWRTFYFVCKGSPLRCKDHCRESHRRVAGKSQTPLALFRFSCETQSSHRVTPGWLQPKHSLPELRML